ncbi:MAG: Coenzyme F420 hydrogenase/dehydrogenase, beta subunit C-terminal domain [Clostridia bacterium]|nr:Coenzyme F420 hydrogenase/dehydrogenase, beta subunit C-terminal domain [Clostridia bacterium]
MLNTESFACTGCAACFASCPTKAICMTADGEGFAYPVIDPVTCIQCGLCERVCPALAAKNKKEKDEPRPVLVAAAKLRGEGAREKSQSGGAFFALARATLAAGGVVYGARLDADMRVHHARAETEAEAEMLRGSKYVQSDVGESYAAVKRDLVGGRRVLFCGTPCQVAGLYAYLRGDHDGLLTADLICHGVPSPRLWADYLAWQEKRHKRKVTRAEFRDLSAPWGVSREALWFGDKKVIDTVFATLYYSRLALRPACYTCPFGKEQAVSDITLGDFWGIEDTPLSDFADSRGVSAVVAHTEKGKEALLASDMELRPTAFVDVAAKNPNLTAPTARPAGREKFWEEYERGFAGVARRYGGFTPKNRLKRIIKRLLRRN